MNMVSYIILNLLLFSSWFILLFKKRESLSFVDRLIGTFILSITQIILTEMILGVIFKRLYATPLFVFNLSISLFIIVITMTMTRDLSIYRELKERVVRVFSVIEGDIVLSLISIIFIISICWIIFLGYLFPSYTWDALWYHLPIVGYIIQSGAIQENPAPSMIDQFINIFPKNIELFFLWNIIFLKSDVITDLSQLLFTIMGVFTIYSIAIKLGVERRYAIYSGLLFFFTPIIILQSTTNYVDIAVSVLFLIAVNFLMHDNPVNCTNNEFETKDTKMQRLPILLAGITTGILLGSKGSGPLFVIVLSTAIVLQKILRHRCSLKPPNKNFIRDSLTPYLLYFILPSFLIGGYWYIKNWFLYDNPVYPMEISFLNITIFKGLYSGIIDPAPRIIESLSPIKGLIHIWLERVEYYLYDSRLSGFGPIWFIMSLPSIIFSLIYALKKRDFRFLFLSMILIATFILHPRSWNTRYVIFIVGLGALSSGIVLEYFKERGKTLKIIILILVLYTAITSNSPAITPDKIGEFIQLPSSSRTIVEHDPFNIHLQARQEYEYWRWISSNISKGDVLAYTFEPLFLSPLWNKEFSNKIVYIKADSYNEWLRELKDEKTTHILIRTRSPEDKWIEEENELISSYNWLGNIKRRFEVVFLDENYKIIRFLPHKDLLSVVSLLPRGRGDIKKSL